MISKQELEKAAFWEERVCLPCGEVCEETECENCGEPTVPADQLFLFLQKIWEGLSE